MSRISNQDNSGLRVKIDNSRNRQTPKTSFGDVLGTGLSKTADTLTASRLVRRNGGVVNMATVVLNHLMFVHSAPPRRTVRFVNMASSLLPKEPSPPFD